MMIIIGKSTKNTNNILFTKMNNINKLKVKAIKHHADNDIEKLLGIKNELEILSKELKLYIKKVLIHKIVQDRK